MPFLSDLVYHNYKAHLKQRGFVVMTRQELFKFVNGYRWAVEATVGATCAVRASVIGFVATEKLEIFFDALTSSRKYVNLQKNPAIALVIGWDDEQTVQYEGLADWPKGEELEFFKSLYFQKFPDGRDRALLANISYTRVKPTWVRYSDFRTEPPIIQEFGSSEI